MTSSRPSRDSARPSRLFVPAAAVGVAGAIAAVAVVLVGGGVRGSAQAGDEKEAAARGQFPLSLLATESGETLDSDWGYASEDCAECHPDQFADWKGSIHSRAHHDSLYLAFAKLARKEGGEEMYRFCSGCHAPAAVASGEIPGGKDREETHHTADGVSCVVCHSVTGMKVVHAGGGANGSLLLGDGSTMFGPLADAAKTPAHESKASDLHTKADFCSNCHTLTHPTNGTVIENTFEEWRKSPYAAAGIQCQDCHMRTVEQAVLVARTMKPLKVPGRTTNDDAQRPDVHRHRFIGASVNAAVNGTSEAHAAEAEARLRSAATVAVEAPAKAAPGAAMKVVVAVTNQGAGHSIPTSITELRQVWIDVRVTDAAGADVFRSGAIDDTGRVDPKAAMFHSVLHDEKGEVTFLPWRAAKIAHERLIPAKGTERETYEVTVPAGTKGPLRVTATLRYRSAPQDKLDALFGKGTFAIRAVDMALGEAVVATD